MSEFTPIQTQEEFDKAIKGRLAQKDRELEEKFKDYLSPEKVADMKKAYEEKLDAAKELAKESEAKASEAVKSMSELTQRAEKAELSLLKQSVANKNKIPLELADRLVGTTEDELMEDANRFATFMKPLGAPPLHSNETRGNGDGSTNNGMLSLLNSLNNTMSQ